MYYEESTSATHPPHYYGDIVRKLFVLGGVVMLVTEPFFTDFLPVSVFVSLVIIVFLGIFAGLTSPRHRWVQIVNMLIAAVAVFVFEYYAIDIYLRMGLYGIKTGGFFWVNQALAVIFFAALYFGSKTLRGRLGGRDGAILRGPRTDPPRDF